MHAVHVTVERVGRQAGRHQLGIQRFIFQVQHVQALHHGTAFAGLLRARHIRLIIRGFIAWLNKV